jgi:hypothetical protein
MWPPRAGALRRALLTGALTFALVRPDTGSTEEPAPAKVLDWETGAGKSYLIPALEIPGFTFGVNQFTRHSLDSTDYDSDGHTIWRNLRTTPVFDKDPFNVNQIDHPYLGSMYFGLGRSAGLSFWESKSFGVGAVAHVQKPFTLTTFRAAIGQALAT